MLVPGFRDSWVIRAKDSEGLTGARKAIGEENYSTPVQHLITDLTTAIFVYLWWIMLEQYSTNTKCNEIPFVKVEVVGIAGRKKVLL